MQKTMKIEDWKRIRPFEYFMTPLLKAITKVRDTLLKMHKDGHLRIKYVVEDNTELQNQIIAMVKQDNQVQWLVGDELKQDQFKFLYDTIKIIYDSALREKYISDDENVRDLVIPMLVAYRSIMFMRNIQLRKADEAKKAREKEEREGLPKKKVEEEKEGHIPTNEQIIEQRMNNEAGGSSLSYQ